MYIYIYVYIYILLLLFTVHYWLYMEMISQTEPMAKLSTFQTEAWQPDGHTVSLRKCGQNGVILQAFSTLRPRQDGLHFPDDIIKISWKFVPKGPINYILTLVQIMAWRRPGDKPSSEPMMVSLLTHICVTRPQWVKSRNRCIVEFQSAFDVILKCESVSFYNREQAFIEVDILGFT